MDRIKKLGFDDFHWVFYVAVTNEQKDKISKDLETKYPNRFTEFELYNHIRDNSCKYCLEYGHTSPTIKKPFKCPTVPSNFEEKVVTLAQKYNLERDLIADLALKRAGCLEPTPTNIKYAIWNWSVFEQYLKRIVINRMAKL